jgi:hypothetical protein
MCATSFFFLFCINFSSNFCQIFILNACVLHPISHTWVETTHVKFEQDICFCWIENNGNIGFRDWWWWPQWGQALGHHHQESSSQALGLPWAQFDVLLEVTGHLGLTLTEHWWHTSFAWAQEPVYNLSTSKWESVLLQQVVGRELSRSCILS